ncbi:SDR family oxidoreductase [Geomonas limicola]|uniref:SDR family oxidoreductase n=1 Tax=Geomonas limicola TaxID=2740186 RepID=UPI002484179A|nr:SDR family oxidoreductase [Geomonas limicola]
MTGATGFLGSHLMAELLRRGHAVLALGRSAGGSTLQERIARQLDWFGLQPASEQLQCVEADLLKPHLGLAPAAYRALCRPATFVHLASDTRFAAANRAASLATNVGSLAAVLDFARDCSAPFFHYVSTAYVFPAESALCREEPVALGEFANIYEESKARAELEVISRCRDLALPYSILRPSIVYGDCQTGRSNSFTALYHHVKALELIRDIYLNDLTNQGGAKSRLSGIERAPDGTLKLPLRIVLPRKGHLNLIPIDFFLAATLQILSAPRPDTIYHLTSRTPSTMEELASFCENFLGIEGIEICYGAEPGNWRPNPAEALFNKLIEPYRPYLSDTRSFDSANLDAVAPEIVAPTLSYPIFERCMRYAVEVNWGATHRNGSGFPVR